MNNPTNWENTFGYSSVNWVSPTKKLDQEDDNCPANCPAKINGLPFWLNNRPFWPYKCQYCSAYQFKKGKVSGGWDD